MFAYLRNENARRRATFDVLGIGPHVLTTPSRTIALPSIATVTVGADPNPRPRVALAIAGIVLTVATLAAASSPEGFGEGPLAWALLFAVGAIASLAAAILPGDRKTYLMVTTTDGLITRFHGQDTSVLEQVREILTAKLDGGQPGLTCTVNFKTGALEPFRQAGTTAGDGAAHDYDERTANPAAPTQAPQSPTTAGRAAATPSSGSARPAAQQRPATSQPAPGGRAAQSGAPPNQGSGYANGQGNGYANGHMPSVLPSIDFFDLLPSVVEMHRFYARDPNAAHVERRLSELELLMRSGAQTQGQRTRIVELAQDLAHYLQGYPPAVRVFQDIAETVSR